MIVAGHDIFPQHPCRKPTGLNSLLQRTPTTLAWCGSVPLPLRQILVRTQLRLTRMVGAISSARPAPDRPLDAIEQLDRGWLAVEMHRPDLLVEQRLTTIGLDY